MVCTSYQEIREQSHLDSHVLNPDVSLADLYDETTMPAEL